VLGQCPALDHLNLSGNQIGAVGEGSLRASWRGQASALILDEAEQYEVDDDDDDEDGLDEEGDEDDDEEDDGLDDEEEV
jgi:hypothetical protein